MRAVRVILAATLISASGGLAFAQTRPAEAPPPRYDGREFVDSNGCVFARVGITATIGWVPRIGPDGEAICGKTPTFGPPAGKALAAAPDEGAPAAAEVSAEAPAAAPPARQAPRTRAKAAARRPGPLLLVEAELLGTGALICPAHVTSASRYWLSDGRRITKCGPPADDPVVFVNGLGVPGLAVAGADPEPDASRAARALGDKGYRVVWTGQTGSPVTAPATSTPALAAGVAHFVQVGAFAVPANVDRALGAIAELDLPAARQTLHKGALTAVLAGPFPTVEAASRALDALTSSGYPNAYLRTIGH